MISARSSTCGAEAEPAAEDDAEAEAEAGAVHGEIIAASFRTEAQKLALCEKCLQSLSPRTLPVAASIYETDAEEIIAIQNKNTFRNSGTPVRRTERRKSQKMSAVYWL